MEFIGPRIASANGYNSSSQPDSSVFNRVYTSPNGAAGVTLRGDLLLRGFEPYGRFLRFARLASASLATVVLEAFFCTNSLFSLSPFGGGGGYGGGGKKINFCFFLPLVRGGGLCPI